MMLMAEPESPQLRPYEAVIGSGMFESAEHDVCCMHFIAASELNGNRSSGPFG